MSENLHCIPTVYVLTPKASNVSNHLLKIPPHQNFTNFKCSRFKRFAIYRRAVDETSPHGADKVNTDCNIPALCNQDLFIKC